MREAAQVLQDACRHITSGDLHAASTEIEEHYPYLPLANQGRKYTEFECVATFCRDGFVDRYSGARLVNPAALRVLSVLLPSEFPFHPNWKQSESHIAYWELFPTIDHVVPVARGGSDSEENWVTTSMFRNSAKGNALLEEIGWTLHPGGKLSEWDGLSRWAVDYYERQADALKRHETYPKHAKYIERWARASIRALNAT